MMYEKEREQLCRICHALFERGLVSGADGNVSMRLPEDAMLITPSGVCKGFLQPEQLLVQGFDGEIREGNLRSTSLSRSAGSNRRRESSLPAFTPWAHR